MSPLQLIFLIVSAVGLLSALGAVLARNLVHAALFLVAFFFAVACQFVLLEAEFLAAMQVLVYIGAISILLLFGIMLTRNIQGDETTGGHWGWKIPAGIVALGVFGVLLYGIASEQGRPGQPPWSRVSSRPGGVNPRVGGPESTALATGPSAQFLASADADGRVRLRSFEGRQVAALLPEDLIPTAVAFSPESSLVAAADDLGHVRAWDVRSRVEILERSGGRPGPITALALGPIRSEADRADRVVAAGGADGVLRIWDGPEPAEIEAHDGPVAAMIITPDGRLISAGLDRRFVARDLRSIGEARTGTVADGRRASAVAIGLAPPYATLPRSDGEGDSDGAPPPLPAEGVLVAFATVADGESGRWDLQVLNASDGATVIELDGLSGTPLALSLAPGARSVAAIVRPEPGPDDRAVVRIWSLDGGDDDPEAEAFPVPPGPIGEAPLLVFGPGDVQLGMARDGASIAFFDDRDGYWTPPIGPTVTLANAVADMPRAVGDELMTRFVVPFEVAGLLLTAALVGAIILARQDPREPPPPLDPASEGAPDPPRPPTEPTVTPGEGTMP